MVTQRTQGLYRLFLLCQIVIVAALFWFGVWVMVTFYAKGAELTWRRYGIYCAMLVIGLLGESLSREGSKRYFLQSELLRQHRLALRQTFASAGVLVFYLVATKDSFISRIFFFNFLPWLDANGLQCRPERSERLPSCNGGVLRKNAGYKSKVRRRLRNGMTTAGTQP